MNIVLNFGVILSEIIFLVVACFIFLVDRFVKSKSYSFILTLVTIFLGTFLVILSPFGVFSVSYQNDFYSSLLKFFMCFGMLLIALISNSYIRYHEKLNYGEYYGFLLFSLIGAFITVSSMDLVTLYLGMELMSFPIYFLIALNHVYERNALEGAFKYFALGCLGAVFMLLGFGLLYHQTGSLVFVEIFKKIASSSGSESALLLAFLLILVGFSIKLTLVPFHMWAPDAYQSAPIPITAFISSLVKFVVIAALVKITMIVFISIKQQIGDLLIPIVLSTILIGNILAIKQDHIIRMLAYSSIAHAGYATLGFIGGEFIGYSFVVFYMIVYLIMTIGMFSILVVLANHKRDLLLIPELAGLSQRSPFISFLILIFMFSLAGIPPTAGFIAKFYLILNLIKVNYIYVALLVVLFSVIGAYPYLRVLKVIYMDKKESDFQYKLRLDFLIPACLTAFLILIIGIYPKPWTELIYKTFYIYLSFMFFHGPIFSN